MKVLALISGGKDSAYCAMRCQEHGHELIALANLYPRDAATDDLDSWMFQTVGYQILPEYSRYVCIVATSFQRF